MPDKRRIAIFGPGLASFNRNGAAKYCRGIIRGLASLGHEVTYHEPELADRRIRADIDDAPWVRVVRYPAKSADDAIHAVFAARDSDVIIKMSGLGAFDEIIEREVLELQDGSTIVLFWDLDPAITLSRSHRMENHAFVDRIARFDCIVNRSGGDRVASAYATLGAQRCVPIHNALDPATHFPVASDPRYWCDMAFIGNRLPERERRIEEFFLLVAECLPDRVFLLGGDGWDSRDVPGNVIRLSHVPTNEHNALHCSATTVLSVSRSDAAASGCNPSARIFEAAGAAACIITDEWDGLTTFLEPRDEVLVARSGADVVDMLERLHRDDAAMIGAAARRRVHGQHTYTQRALQLTGVFESLSESRNVAARSMAVRTCSMD